MQSQTADLNQKAQVQQQQTESDAQTSRAQTVAASHAHHDPHAAPKLGSLLGGFSVF